MVLYSTEIKTNYVMRLIEVKSKKKKSSFILFEQSYGIIFGARWYPATLDNNLKLLAHRKFAGDMDRETQTLLAPRFPDLTLWDFVPYGLCQKACAQFSSNLFSSNFFRLIHFVQSY